MKYSSVKTSEFWKFAERISDISGPGFSANNSPIDNKPRGPSAAFYSAVACRDNLSDGCPLIHVVKWQRKENNLKITPSLHSKSGLTLLYLDADAHKDRRPDADPQEANKLYDLTQDKLPHGKRMISDRGGSAYVLVDTRVRPNIYVAPGEDREVVEAREYRKLVDRIEKYFQSVKAFHDLKLSGCEVIGKPLVMTKTEITCPDLLKCPQRQECLAEPVTWKQLSETDWTPLVKLDKKARSGGSRVWTLTLEQQNGIDHLESVVDEYFPSRLVNYKHGSDTRPLCPRRFAEILFVLTETDASKKKNYEGTNPYSFHKAKINSYWEEGIFEFGYNHSAYKSVRDWMSDQGMIDAKDWTYTPPVRNAKGEVETKGRAAEWSPATWIKVYLADIMNEGKEKEPLKEEVTIHTHTSGLRLSDQVELIAYPSGRPINKLSLLRTRKRYPVPDWAYSGLCELGLAC